MEGGPIYISDIQRTTLGRWYYEFTHISGPSRYLAGFEFEEGHKNFFSIYPHEILPDSETYYCGCTAQIEPYKSIGFQSLKPDSTIGISFDAFTNRIDFRTETEIK